MTLTKLTRIISLCLSLTPLVVNATGDESVIGISNGNITVKQDLKRGGAICFLSSKDDGDRNIVNIYDEGRYIQQSYYAGKNVNRQSEGQSPSWSPWSWNPIQGGNYDRKGARILTHEVTDSTIYVKCIPMLWDMNNHEAEAIMEQWTTFIGKNTVKVRNRITCNRTDTIYGVKTRDQEIPAVYPISALKNLYGYFGDKPFTGDSIQQTEVVQIHLGVPGSFWGKYPNVPEKWMAFVNDNLWGMAVYSPIAERFIAGRYDDNTEGDAYDVSTSYIAPLLPYKLGKKSVMDYEYYLVVDSLDNIRETIYKLYNNNILSVK